MGLASFGVAIFVRNRKAMLLEKFVTFYIFSALILFLIFMIIR